MTDRLAKRSTKDVVAPRVDVYESDSELMLVADLPGVSKDDVEVRFEEGELVIDGRRTADKRGAPLAVENVARDFHRAFALPDGLDVDHVVAELEAGVLRVRLPKAPQKRARKIDVRAG